MGYQRFEDLPVWNDAIELAVRLPRISQAGLLNGLGDLKNQLERAAISVSNNIAEGYERGTSEELITFLYIARGSSGEVRSMLHLLDRLHRLEELESEIRELRLRTESISRQLGGWIEAVKNSKYKGHRSQNDRSRAASRAIRRRDQFLEKVREIQDGAIRRGRPSPEQDPALERGVAEIVDDEVIPTQIWRFECRRRPFSNLRTPLFVFRSPNSVPPTGSPIPEVSLAIIDLERAKARE